MAERDDNDGRDDRDDDRSTNPDVQKYGTPHQPDVDGDGGDAGGGEG